MSASPARRLPVGIWAMGFGSMLMDISSEMVHSLLPIFMVTVLGASMVSVGLIEGIAEATASIVKVFSGALSDRLRRRKAAHIEMKAILGLPKVGPVGRGAIAAHDLPPSL